MKTLLPATGRRSIILTKALHRIGGNTFSAILTACPFYPEEMTAEEVKVAKKAISGTWKRAGFTKVKGDYYILEGETLNVVETEQKVQANLRKKRKA